jgi:gliding motility-associated-like protein
MARRRFTNIILALGLLCSIVASIRVQAQAVTFAINPTQITPAVGDIVSLNVTTQNFTNIVSLQYSIEWDAALMSYVAMDSLNIPDASQFGINPVGGNSAIVVWSSSGTAKSVPNGQRLFKIRLRILAASSNYWAKFSNANLDNIEVIQDPGLRTVTPTFVSLGIPPGTSAVPLVAKATGGSTLTGQKVCVPITTSDFTNVVSAQWVNKWNPTVLRFDSVSALNSTLGLRTTNFGTTQVGNGRMTFSWNAPSGSASVANDAVLYNVCYTAIGASGTSSTVVFDSAEVYRRNTAGDSRVNLNGTNATVTVGTVVLPPTTGLIFTASNETVASGDNVCVKIRTAGFNNVASMQWSMHFDSTKMTLLNASSNANIGINTSIPGDLGIPRNTTGTLTFVWISSTGVGVSVPDSTVLMEICFKYIGAPNTNSYFRFDGIPTKMKVSDGADIPVTIPSTFRTGNVSAAVAAATSVTGTASNVSCPSGSDGKVTLTPTGGNGTYTYSWTGPSGFTATTKDITARAGTYSVTVTSNGTSKTETFNITEPAAFALSTQVINVNCKGGINGAITLTPAGGTAPYTYNWAGTTTTPTAKDLLNLAAGTYKLTLTDAKNCTTTREETVTEPATALTATVVATNLACKNGASGTIVTTPTGGTAPYTYNWSGTTTTPTAKDLSGLAAGVYNLTVTDAKNCTSTLTQTLTEPDGVKIGTATVVGTRCSQPAGTITVTAATGGSGSGYTYSWTGPNNYTGSGLSLTGLNAGAYILTAKDSKSCEAKETFTVTDVAANITTSAPSIINTTCFGGQNGEISVSAIAPNPLTYAWTGPNGFTATTLNIRNLFAGNYNLTINDGTCAKTVAATVGDAPAIVSTPQSVNIKCKGTSTGSIALNATGGTGALSIAWTGPNGFTGTGQSIGSLAVGTYTARITDASSCVKTETITLTEPTETVKITEVITNVDCNGNNNGKIVLTVSGGTPQYSYAWTGVSGFVNTQKDVTSLLGGEYRVTVSDANGCTVSSIYTVRNPDVLVVNSGTTDAGGTPNGTITLNPVGGTAPYTYLWTGQGVNPTAQNQTGLCSGTYSVNVKDAAQCSSSKTITVGGSCSTPMRVLGSATITAAGCAGSNAGQISINWEGGVAPFMVEWYLISSTGGEPSKVFEQTVQARNSILTNRPSGMYAVKIKDAVGQTLATQPYTITGSATPVALTAAIADETCRGTDGSIAITIGQGGAAPFKLAWLDNNGANDVYDRRGMVAGTYAVKVTDANMCIKEMGGLVIKKTPCPLTISPATKVNPTCFGGNNGSITIEITNGEPPFTVTSSGGTVVRNSGLNRGASYTISGLVDGTYTILVKDTIGTQTIVQTLNAPTQIMVGTRITGDQGSCNGSIILTPTGGVGNYTYQWNTGATSRDLFNLCCNDGRRYSVTVRDANGCQVSTPNDTVSCNIAALTLASTTVRNPLCQSDQLNSRIDVTPAGGVPPYVSEWRNESGAVVGTNSPILLNQPPGRYYLTLSDSRLPNPQKITFDAVLKVTSTLAVGQAAIKCAKDNITEDGGITIPITGGAAPYSVRWPDGTVSVVLTNVATTTTQKAGKGEVTITDLNGCVIKVEVTVCSDACATIRINTTYVTPKETFNIKCATNADGGATVLSLSTDYRTPIRAYQWTTGEVGATAFKLAPGFNQVTVTDADGKTCVSRIFMKAPTVRKDTIWVDDKARTLESIPTGGVAPYTYRWATTNADTSRKITVNKSGRYVVIASDFLGCSDTRSAEIVLDATCLEGSIILTPNDDGRNENFRFKTCDIKKVRLEVYNRWGQVVYTNNDYRDQWYGNNQDGQSGDQLPEGVYMYILSGLDASGKQQLGKGTVNIVRY